MWHHVVVVVVHGRDWDQFIVHPPNSVHAAVLRHTLVLFNYVGAVSLEKVKRWTQISECKKKSTVTCDAATR